MKRIFIAIMRIIMRHDVYSYMFLSKIRKISPRLITNNPFPRKVFLFNIRKENAHR